MRNYLLKIVLSGYLAFTSLTDTSYATNVPRISFYGNHKNETPLLPLEIFIPLPNEPKSEFYLQDYFRYLYDKFRFLLERNQKPTLAPGKVEKPKKESKLEIKVDVEIK